MGFARKNSLVRRSGMLNVKERSWVEDRLRMFRGIMKANYEESDLRTPKQSRRVIAIIWKVKYKGEERRAGDCCCWERTRGVGLGRVHVCSIERALQLLDQMKLSHMMLTGD